MLALAPHRYRVGLRATRSISSLTCLDTETLDSLYRGLVSHWHPLSVVITDKASRRRRSIHPAEISIDDPVAKMMLLDLVTYLPDDILTKVDRAAMSVSLETRVPLLDHRVVEFAWRFLSRRISIGTAKGILRSVLYRYVPKALVDRPKMGFGVPIDSWLRGPLKDWANDLLDPVACAAKDI